MKQNIGVIFGGVSPEHDISIITAMQVIANLNTYLYNIIPLYIGKDGRLTTSKYYDNIDNFKKRKNVTPVLVEWGTGYILLRKKWHTKEIRLHACVVCNHGANGEDGALSGALRMANVPFTCPDILGSAIGCDKVVFKDIVNSLNINNIPYVSVTEEQYYNDPQSVQQLINDKLQFPVIIKPARLGSSIGIKVCNNADKLQENIEYCLQFDKKLLVEQFVDIVKEINIALYYDNGIVTSNIEQVEHKDVILSFDNKYLSGNAKGMEGLKRLDPKLSLSQKKYIEQSAKQVYEHLGLKGVVRFDYIISDKVYLNEINTIPGSMANYLFKDVSFANQLTAQIKYAINTKYKQDSKINYFNSSVLDNKFDFIKK